MIIKLGILGIVLIAAVAVLAVRGLRRLAEGCTQHHTLSEPRVWQYNAKWCKCYQTDENPHRPPYWVNGPVCEKFYLTNGRWPPWCDGPAGFRA